MSADQEERLLHQLREITRVMQEGRLVEGFAPEKGAQDWEGRLLFFLLAKCNLLAKR